jgi:hypothetical protein
MLLASDKDNEVHEIQVLESDRGWARWRCSCGLSSGGRWYASAEEALKAAERHRAKRAK